MLRDTLSDLTFALRIFRNNRVFFAVAVLALAIGIGANTTVFSVVEALINFPLPMADPSRAAFVFSENPTLSIAQNAASVDDFLDWREQSDCFEHLVAGTGRSACGWPWGPRRATSSPWWCARRCC